MRWLDSITDSMDMNLSNLREIAKDRGSLACYSPWGHKESGMTEQLNNKNNYSVVSEQKIKVFKMPCGTLGNQDH